MADYVSILRRTLDGLGDKATPSLRERVYSRARDAVKRQLDGMNPPPAEEVVAKQYDNLERAIAEVEASFGGGAAAAEAPDAPSEGAAPDATPVHGAPTETGPAEAATATGPATQAPSATDEAEAGAAAPDAVRHDGPTDDGVPAGPVSSGRDDVPDASTSSFTSAPAPDVMGSDDAGLGDPRSGEGDASDVPSFGDAEPAGTGDPVRPGAASGSPTPFEGHAPDGGTAEGAFAADDGPFGGTETHPDPHGSVDAGAPSSSLDHPGGEAEALDYGVADMPERRVGAGDPAPVPPAAPADPIAGPTMEDVYGTSDLPAAPASFASLSRGGDAAPAVPDETISSPEGDRAGPGQATPSAGDPGVRSSDPLAAVPPYEDGVADYGDADVGVAVGAPVAPQDPPVPGTDPFAGDPGADETLPASTVASEVGGGADPAGPERSLASSIRDGTYFSEREQAVSAGLDPSLLVEPQDGPVEPPASPSSADLDVPRLPRADAEPIGDDLDALRARVGMLPVDGGHPIAPPADQPPVPGFSPTAPAAPDTDRAPAAPAGTTDLDRTQPVPPAAVDAAIPAATAGVGAVAADRLAVDRSAVSTPRDVDARAVTAGTPAPEARLDMPPPATGERRGRGGLVLTLAGLVVVGLGAGWALRDELADASGVEGFRTAFGLEDTIGSMLGTAPTDPAVDDDPADTTLADGGDVVVDPPTADDPTTGGDGPADPAAGGAPTDVAPVDDGPADEGTVDVAATQPDKFDDRLPGADGVAAPDAPDAPVVDVAPADDDASVRDVPTVATDGEGTPATDDPAPADDPAAADPPAADASDTDAPDTDAPVTDGAQETQEVASADPVEPVVAEGDGRGFLVEEPLGGQPAQPQSGAVRWSIVQESPGSDLPTEPAIRGEVRLENGVGVSVTVRRNADAGLPASHLIELVFLQPENGEAIAIERVPVVGFKDSLQVAARPLVAVPAKITDDFHIVGLNNFDTAVESNLALMGGEDFMDVQMLYGNGRRATMTLEKGTRGDEVFAEVLKAWADAPLPG